MSTIQPKYIQVQQRLLARIHSGELVPGERLPSEAELCRQFGVSRITVRRALAELASQGYVRSRGGFGHIVQTLEPAPVVGLMMNYSIFGQTQEHRVFSRFALLLMNALRLELRRRGCRHRLYMPEPHETEHQFDHDALRDDLERGALAGLITAGWPHEAHKHDSTTHFSDTRLAERIQHHGIPLVSVTGRDVRQASTSTDYLGLGYLGAEYFLQRGIDRIGLLTLNQRNSPTRDGFEQALADHGRQARDAWVFGVEHRDERSGFEAFARWWPDLANQPRPSALVIDDDQTGKGAMLAACMLGADTDDTLRIACQSLLGAGTFWPRPCVKLQLDPMAYASNAVAKIMRMLADPGVEAACTSVRPVVVEDQSDVAPRLGSRASQAPTAPLRTKGRHLRGEGQPKQGANE